VVYCGSLKEAHGTYVVAAVGQNREHETTHGLYPAVVVVSNGAPAAVRIPGEAIRGARERNLRAATPA